MIEMNAEGTPYVGIQVSSISGLQSYGIMVGDFGDELTLPVDGGSTQQLEAYKDKGKEKVRIIVLLVCIYCTDVHNVMCAFA